MGTNGERRRIFVAPATGGGASQITAGGLKQWAPSWSPDGREIAFLNTPIANDNQAGRDQLANTLVGGGGTDVLYGHPRPGDIAGTPGWSPDGSRIAFGVESWGSAEWQCDGQLMTMDADGGTPTRVMCNPHAAPEFIDWSPRVPRGETKLISAAHGSATQGAGAVPIDVALARNGRYSFFSTRATDVTDTPDNDGKADVFRRDLIAGDVESSRPRALTKTRRPRWRAPTVAGSRSAPVTPSSCATSRMVHHPRRHRCVAGRDLRRRPLRARPQRRSGPAPVRPHGRPQRPSARRSRRG